MIDRKMYIVLGAGGGGGDLAKLSSPWMKQAVVATF